MGRREPRVTAFRVDVLLQKPRLAYDEVRNIKWWESGKLLSFNVNTEDRITVLKMYTYVDGFQDVRDVTTFYDNRFKTVQDCLDYADEYWRDDFE